MQMATCKLPEGASITVIAGANTRTFVAGARVDLDAVAAPEVPKTNTDQGRKAATWREALGHHVEDHFELDASDASVDAQAAAHEE